MSRGQRGGRHEQVLLGQWGYFVGVEELVYSYYKDGRVTVRKVRKRKKPVGNSTLFVSSEYRVWGVDGYRWPTPDWKWGQIPDSVEEECKSE